MAREIRLTNDEYLVLVLEEYLEEVGNDEIDCFDLTVRVWKKSNESFGLKKYVSNSKKERKIISTSCKKSISANQDPRSANARPAAP